MTEAFPSWCCGEEHPPRAVSPGSRSDNRAYLHGLSQVWNFDQALFPSQVCHLPKQTCQKTPLTVTPKGLGRLNICKNKDEELPVSCISDPSRRTRGGKFKLVTEKDSWLHAHTGVGSSV